MPLTRIHRYEKVVFGLVIVCVALIAATAYRTHQVTLLSRRVDHSTAILDQRGRSLHLSCIRGNVVRDNIRFLLREVNAVFTAAVPSQDSATRRALLKVIPEFAVRTAAPGIQHQPCDVLYPVR